MHIGMKTTSAITLPPKNYRRIIDELSVILSDPVSKLKFLKEAVNEHQNVAAPYKFYPSLAESIFCKNLLDRAERIRPGSKQVANALMRQGVISAPQTKLWRIYKFRHAIACAILMLFFSGLGTALASLAETFNTLLIVKKETEKKPNKIIIVRKPILYPLIVASKPSPPASIVKFAELQNSREKLSQNTAVIFPEYLKSPIWLVEKTSHHETYSNGLQIITTHTVANIEREYPRFSRNLRLQAPQIQTSNKVAGIVYHASESDILPFKPEMNTSIKKYSQRLIKYIQRKKSYHYLIDRFGRIYRLVREDHAAFHAGNSVWADDQQIYLNLNHEFIGVCFEGRDFEEAQKLLSKDIKSSPAKFPRLKPTGISSFNEAQLRSGKELTDWLRVKYQIPQTNCVPHALISVNPNLMLIGYHLDLSRGFPFKKFGLSDKYSEPLPSIVEFGFFYDDYFEDTFDGNIWPGIHKSEEILQRWAGFSGLSLSEYRKYLNNRFNQFARWKDVIAQKGQPIFSKDTKKNG
jgi:hypothetical protein